jgi:import inner membrane translocase subunit TIM44
VGSNTRYGGYVEKEARRRRREARLKQLGKDGMGRLRVRVPENPEAGENIVLHANASSEPETSNSVRSRLPPSLQKWLNEVGESYRESDNAFVSMSRGFTNTMHRWFIEENETARVVGWMKTLDPDFQMESFLRELREYIIPEVVDAFVSADIKTLREWTSEAVSTCPTIATAQWTDIRDYVMLPFQTYNVLTATIQPYIQKGLISDSKVLDIRGVDVSFT